MHGQHWDLPTALQAYSSLKNTLLENNQQKESNTTMKSTPVLDTQLKKEETTSSVKLPRRLSSATGNDTLMTRVRSRVEKEFSEVDAGRHTLQTPVYTFTLPDLTIYSEDFRGYLERELLDFAALASLEQSNKLNWWVDSGTLQKLWPLATTGDGNCLLHAASLAMWGFHDRLLTLRKALHEYMMMNKKETTALWRRWRWKQMQANKLSSLILTEEEWKKEWDIILSLSSAEPKIDEHRPSMKACNGTTAKVYQGLEDIHVMALAQILKRPIVVLSDTYLKDVRGEPFAPIPFGGIYLPLDCSPLDCHRSPLLLCYHLAHFSGLAAMDTVPRPSVPPAAIPLTDAQEELLPINFVEDPGEGFLWNSENEDLVGNFNVSLSSSEKTNILRKYLDVMKVPVPPGNKHQVFKKSSATAMQTIPLASNHQSGEDLMSFSWNHILNAADVNRSGTVAPTSTLEKKSFVETAEQQYILCAMLHKDSRPVYQDQMKNNYITAAKEQFHRSKQLKDTLNIDDVRTTMESTPSTTSTTSAIKFDIFETRRSSLISKKHVRFAEIISEEIPIKETFPENHSEECTSKLCQSIGCKFFGNREMNYFCSICWADRSKQLCTTVKVEAHEPIKQNTTEEGLVKACKNANCSFYGNPKTEFYCSKCWINFAMRSTLEEASSKNNPEETSPYPCSNSSCTFFGNPQTYYFCSKCYKDQLLTM